MTNVNIELFERTSPVKRIETVRNLTQVGILHRWNWQEYQKKPYSESSKRQDGELKEAGTMNSM